MDSDDDTTIDINGLNNTINRIIEESTSTSTQMGFEDTEAETFARGLTDKDDSKFKLNNKRLMVTYRTHINKDDLKRLFASKGQELSFFRAAHETADSANPYEHTHVVVDYQKALQSNNCRVFDILGIHPNIKVIKTNLHFTNAKKYLAKEDPENEDLKDCKTKEQQDRDITKDIWGCKNVSEALELFGNLRNASNVIATFNNRPKIVPDLPKVELKYWQVTMEEELTTPWIKSTPKADEVKMANRGILDANTPLNMPVVWKTTNDGRNIIVIYNPEGCVGKSIFIDYMIVNWPDRFIMLQGIPPIRDLAETIKIELNKGWTGETVLINLVRQCSDKKFYEPLEALCDGSMTSHKYTGGTMKWPVRNIVLFSNFMPKLNAVTLDRWDIRTVRSDGWLQRIPLAEARLIYKNEKHKRKNDERLESESTFFGIKPT